MLGIDAPELEVLRHRILRVEGLRALVHEHFVVDEVQRLANRLNIHTGASFPGRDRLRLLHVNALCIHALFFLEYSLVSSVTFSWLPRLLRGVCWGVRVLTP